MALEKRGALWVKEGPKGKYLSGEIEFDDVKRNIMVFKNSDKWIAENPNRPAYEIVERVEDDEEIVNPASDEIPF